MARGGDIVIDGIGGEVLSEALGALALEGSLTTLGYSASRKATIDVTDLIVPQASIRSLNMFRQSQATVTDAWNAIVSLLQSGAIKPIVAKTFPLAEAADALRHLVEGRPLREGRSHDLTTFGQKGRETGAILKEKLSINDPFSSLTAPNLSVLIHLASGQLNRCPQLLTCFSLTVWAVFSQQVSSLELHPWIGWYAR